MKKLILSTIIAAMLTMTACGNKSDTTNTDTSASTTETTTTAAEVNTTVEETTPDVATSSESDTNTDTAANTTTAATTTAATEFDLDAAIASAESMIPDVPIVSKKDTDSNTDQSTTTTTTTMAATTTTIIEADTPQTNAINCEQELIFCGQYYDNRSFTDNMVAIPSDWNVSANDKQYENTSYPGCYIIKNVSTGVSFSIAEAKRDGKTNIPDLQLYKNLTWGATVSDMKAAYGEPIHEGTSNLYNSALTTLWYRSSDGSTILYSVSDKWGLVEINCSGNR